LKTPGIMVNDLQGVPAYGAGRAKKGYAARSHDLKVVNMELIYK